MIDIQSFYETDSGSWTYLVADSEEKQAVIIDPVWVYDPVSGKTDAAFIEQVLDRAEQCGYEVTWVLETHAHADHLTAAGLIRQRIEARIACGRGICAVQEIFGRVFNMELPTDGSQFDRLLRDGDRIPLGQAEIRVMETPGHTGDSVTYLVEDAAFIGDTLFAPAFGTARCDFPGGDAGRLFDSITSLYQLPSDTRLFLCHDYPEDGAQAVCEITVGRSMRDNIHLSSATRKEDFIAMRTERDSQLGMPRLILPALQVNILAGAAPAAERNGVAYLRIPFNHSLADLIKGDH